MIDFTACAIVGLAAVAVWHCYAIERYGRKLLELSWRINGVMMHSKLVDEDAAEAQLREILDKTPPPATAGRSSDPARLPLPLAMHMAVATAASYAARATFISRTTSAIRMVRARSFRVARSPAALSTTGPSSRPRSTPGTTIR